MASIVAFSDHVDVLGYHVVIFYLFVCGHVLSTFLLYPWIVIVYLGVDCDNLLPFVYKSGLFVPYFAVTLLFGV